MKNIKKQWFTLIEILIVLTIIVILSTLWIINYTSSLSESRNTKRISDLTNLSIALKEDKLDKGIYQAPQKNFNISNWNWNIIAYQGEINDEVPLKNILKTPQDPFVKNKNYTYSINKYKSAFELSTTLEFETVPWNDLWLRTYLIWDFKSSNIDNIPSISFATTSSLNIQDIKNKFLLNNLELNLPYDLEGNPYVSAPDFDSIVNQKDVKVPKFFGYATCEEIVKNLSFYWNWNYQVAEESESSINPIIRCITCELSDWEIYWSNKFNFSNNKCKNPPSE